MSMNIQNGLLTLTVKVSGDGFTKNSRGAEMPP